MWPSDIWVWDGCCLCREERRRSHLAMISRALKPHSSLGWSGNLLLPNSTQPVHIQIHHPTSLHAHTQTNKAHEVKMRIAFSPALLTLFTSLAFAAVCEVNSDNCRAVINASACFNKYMTGTNVNNILSCLTGTEGAATNKEKVC